MTAAPSVVAPVHALLIRAIDYAGLFPPAGLELPPAVANYLAYRESPDSWALGRFVVPASQLDRLEPYLPSPLMLRFPLSVLIGADLPRELAIVEGFERRRPGVVEAVELKWQPDVNPHFLPRWSRCFEISLDPAGLDRRLESIARVRGFVKVRTGGVTSDSFPTPEALTRFLVLAARHRLGFKATAGLHHPLRGSYRLTYEAGASYAPMYGYLNLAVAAAVAWSGGAEAEVEAALLEPDPEALHFERDALVWRSLRLDQRILQLLRRDFFQGFGSCSFREPLDELAPLVSR